MRKCKNCDYFEQTVPTRGQCRRNPPQFGTAGWPVVANGSWCGEFVARQKVTKQKVKKADVSAKNTT